jgi:histidyl-tRNA synthetase
MRVLDSKREATKPSPPRRPASPITSRPTRRCTSSGCRQGLDALGIAYRIEPRLVRGLDYYTHTTFEFQATALEGAQNGIGGGGRYNGLAEALGGPPTPGIGFGSGIERILLACDAEGFSRQPGTQDKVFVVDVTDGTHARDLTATAAQRRPRRRSGLRRPIDEVPDEVRRPIRRGLRAHRRRRRGLPARSPFATSATRASGDQNESESTTSSTT